ncbi:MAG TPA: hypothetical protein VGM90_07840 [Kofleriaceae bacterium]|jgi:hypothetical protein
MGESLRSKKSGHISIARTSIGRAALDLRARARGVSDWNTPVFYADDYYWTWNDGGWLRSAWLGGPGVAVIDVPVGLRTVNHPWEFAHYHGAPGLTPRTHVAFHERSAVRGFGIRGRR